MAARGRAIQAECGPQHGTPRLCAATGVCLDRQQICPADDLPLVVAYPLRVRRWPKTWRDLRGFLARSR